MLRLIVILSIFASSLLLSGCTNNEDTRVTDIYTANSTLETEEPAIFQVDFDYNYHDVFDDGDTVSLVVRVPAQLQYLKNSAKLNQHGGNDLIATPYIRKCTDDTTYLAFVFDDNDLYNGHSSNHSDAELSITLTALRRGQEITVAATASTDNVAYGCREEFLADAEEVIDVE